MTSRAWSAALAALSRHGTLLAFIFAALLALPALNSPLFEDDVVHRVMLLDGLPGVDWGPLELYDFVGAPTRPAALLREKGVLPWFTADDLKLRFFRPLSSAVLAGDAELFGDHLWASRLHSVAWFLAIVGLTAALYRHVLPAATAGLATVVYALSVGHVTAVSWIAARHGLICTAFSLVAFQLYVRGREQRLKSTRWLGALALVTGLLAGEMAVGAMALIGSWELFACRDALGRRIRALAPFAALTAVYLACYAALGYGVHGSGAYVGLDSGVAGAAVALRHLLILVGEMAAATPSGSVGFGREAAQWIAALRGAAMALAAYAVFRFARAHVHPSELLAMRWMPVAALVAALPGALAIVGGRVLTLALVPAAGVVAVLLVAGASAVRDGTGSRVVKALVGVAVTLAAIGHLVVAPILRLVVGEALARIAVAQRDQAAHAPSCAGVRVMVAAADPVIGFYAPMTMLLQGRDPGLLRLLGTARTDHRIEHVTRTGFDLVSVDRRVWNVWERLFRGAPLFAGTRITLSSLDATVIEDEGGAPTRVRFDFGEPLDSPHLCFVQWRDGGIRPLAPPKPGQTIELPHHRGPMGF